MSLRVLAAVVAAVGGAAIWSDSGRAADLVGTPAASVPVQVVTAVQSVEAAVPAVAAPVTAAPTPATTVDQAVAQVAEVVSTAVSPASAVEVAPAPRAASQRRSTPGSRLKPRTERVDAPVRIERTRSDSKAALPLVRSNASPSQSRTAARSSERPERQLPPMPTMPFGVAALDAGGVPPLLLLAALVFAFTAFAALEFGAPLRLAPQLLRPQRLSTRLERPG